MSDEARVMELRRLFPVIDHWTYLYNGSIHPCAKPVSAAMRAFLVEWENGGEAAFFKAYEAFGQLKEKFARLIHGNARNIVITESTSAAVNLAAQLIRPQAHQNVVVSELDFMTSTYPWIVSHPAQVRFVKSHGGAVSVEEIAALVDDHTAAVCVCAVAVGSGFRLDLEKLQGALGGRHPALAVDAAQALGVLDLNVNTPPLDFLACTASKWLMGPAGVGFLHVGDRYLHATPPAAGWLSAANVGDWDVRHCRLHEDATRFQGGIPNLVGVVGALAGLTLLEEIGRDWIEQRIRLLTTYAMEELGKTGVTLWTPRPDAQRAGLVFFRCPAHKELHAKLKAERIYCGTFLDGIRIDPNFYNTTQEIDKFLAIVRAHMVANGK